MSTRNLREWLKKRRESRILERIREHIVHIVHIINNAEIFFDFWLEVDKEAAQNSFNLIKEEEDIADEIEAEIIDQLSSGETPKYIRNDLLSFIKLADTAAGSIKRGTDNLLLLIDQDFHIDIKAKMKKIFSLLSEQAQAFIESFDLVLNAELEKIRKKIKLVDKIESDIDGIYKQLKYDMINKTENNSAGALIILDHAIKDIEGSSDLIEDCADLIRAIALL